jgi:hypothetical protein
MAESINSASLQVAIKFTVANNDPVLPQTVSQPAGASKTLSFKTGGASPNANADRMYFGHRTLAAGAAETIDLFGGALAMPYGTAFNVTKLFALVILLDATPAGSAVSVGPGASNGFAAPWSGTTPADKVSNGYNGGLYTLPPAVNANGHVVDSTHRNLTITNLDGAVGVGYTLWAIGKA